MKGLVGLKLGNWFIDARESCYCVVIAVDSVVTVERFKYGVYSISSDSLLPIPITPDNLSIAQFKDDGTYYTRNAADKKLCSLLRTGALEYRFYYDGQSVAQVCYVHDLQNVYEMCTNEKLSINLFGI